MNDGQNSLALDGNAVAGLLQHPFARDLSTSYTRCDSRGREGEVGSLPCKETMARIVITTKDLYLDCAERAIYECSTLLLNQ